jgi:hypothetical protein
MEEREGLGRGKKAAESKSLASWCRCRSRSLFTMQLMAVFTAAASAGAQLL